MDRNLQQWNTHLSMGLQGCLGLPKSPDSALSQCVPAMEAVTIPTLRQTGALLGADWQEGFSHGRSFGCCCSTSLGPAWPVGSS